MVRHVERFKAELQVFLFGQLKSLKSGYVDVLAGVAAQVVIQRVKGPNIVLQLLIRDCVETGHVERTAVRLIPIQIQVAAVVNDVAPGERRA